MPKKKAIKNKSKLIGSWFLTETHVANAIGEVMKLMENARDNGDKIALWTLEFIYEDLVKTFTRLSNIRLTVKGKRD